MVFLRGIRGEVTLAEHQEAQEAAKLEYDRARERGYKHAYKSDHIPAERKIEMIYRAYCAQYAVARWWGVPDYHVNIDSFKSEPDVPPFFEVRYSMNPMVEYVKCWPNDRDGDRLIFVRGWPDLEIVGYIPITLAKQRYPAYDWEKRGAFHRVPLGDLWPL